MWTTQHMSNLIKEKYGDYCYRYPKNLTNVVLFSIAILLHFVSSFSINTFCEITLIRFCFNFSLSFTHVNRRFEWGILLGRKVSAAFFFLPLELEVTEYKLNHSFVVFVAKWREALLRVSCFIIKKK